MIKTKFLLIGLLGAGAAWAQEKILTNYFYLWPPWVWMAGGDIFDAR